MRAPALTKRKSRDFSRETRSDLKRWSTTVEVKEEEKEEEDEDDEDEEEEDEVEWFRCARYGFTAFFRAASRLIWREACSLKILAASTDVVATSFPFLSRTSEGAAARPAPAFLVLRAGRSASKLFALC